MSRTVRARLEKAGPKKILACDGGGILGMISIEILGRVESELRAATGNPKLLLSDWFDFVCGTSTGAIIATCVSLGMEVSRIREFYRQSGPLMFERAAIWNRLRYSYEEEPLACLLRREINRAAGRAENEPPVTLGDEAIRTVLMIVMRNHTTDSPWPVSNNPNARFNHRSREDCNLNLPLWQLIRASTAAPTYFPPEVIVFNRDTAREYQFVFLDGGVTTYNNPAFLSFQMATTKPYGMDWETGPDKLLVVSIGTGSAPRARPGLRADELWLLDHAKNTPAALMNAASAGWDMACRTVGECRFGGPIDLEFGDGVVGEGTESNWSGSKQFSYVRYDPDVTAEGLRLLDLSDISPEKVQVMDSVAHIAEIQRVGVAFSKKVSLTHFRDFI